MPPFLWQYFIFYKRTKNVYSNRSINILDSLYDKAVYKGSTSNYIEHDQCSTIALNKCSNKIEQTLQVSLKETLDKIKMHR